MKVLTFSEITAEEFDTFVEKHPYGNIHQTSKWAEFQRGVKGRGEAILCGVKEGREIRAAGVLVLQKLPMGLYWGFCPRGPLLSYNKPSKALAEARAFWGGMRLFAKQKRLVFVRAEWPAHGSETGYFMQWGLRAHAHYFPEHSLIVDLSVSEEKILKQMKQKGRYNIKIAEREGVKVQESKDVDAFYELFTETTGRDGFSGHPKEYYRDMLKSLGENAKLFLAKYKGKAVAAAIITYYQGVATYYFGASSAEYRNVMAPYLLHWEIMRDAKKRGCKDYDFFGVAPEGDNEHPWAGVTKFKEKFGGERVDYWPAREKPISWFWYLVMRIRKLLRL